MRVAKDQCRTSLDFILNLHYDRDCACNAIFPYDRNVANTIQVDRAELAQPNNVAWALLIVNIFSTVYGFLFCMHTLCCMHLMTFEPPIESGPGPVEMEPAPDMSRRPSAAPAAAAGVEAHPAGGGGGTSIIFAQMQVTHALT